MFVRFPEYREPATYGTLGPGHIPLLDKVHSRNKRDHVLGVRQLDNPRSGLTVRKGWGMVPVTLTVKPRYEVWVFPVWFLWLPTKGTKNGPDVRTIIVRKNRV